MIKHLSRNRCATLYSSTATAAAAGQDCHIFAETLFWAKLELQKKNRAQKGSIVNCLHLSCLSSVTSPCVRSKGVQMEVGGREAPFLLFLLLA
jgi:hypothetical protein